jgi:hypothetical protein
MALMQAQLALLLLLLLLPAVAIPAATALGWPAALMLMCCSWMLCCSGFS